MSDKGGDVEHDIEKTIAVGAIGGRVAIKVRPIDVTLDLTLSAAKKLRDDLDTIIALIEGMR